MRPVVNGSTKVLGVCGYPVEHSLSPAMHNAAIAALGVNYTYVPFSVLPDNVGDAVRAMPALGIVGLNLTIPHKERVLPYLDEIDAEAARVGAVNTVHNDGGVLRGSNTDGRGFAAPLGAMGVRMAGARAVVLGAGGAARSVAFRLAAEGAAVTIANRTLDRADALARVVQTALGVDVDSVALDGGSGLRGAMEAADLLVNTTSVGMWPHEDDPLPVDDALLRADMVVYDLVYRPLETRLLAAARRAGARTLNGVGMLVHQGAISFEVWTGMRPPVDVMERAVLDGLA